MITKFIGMAMIFFSSSALGFCMGESFCVRERELHNMADAVEMMTGELMYTASSLKCVVSDITPAVKGICRDFFGFISRETAEDIPLCIAWENAINKMGFDMSLKKSDMDFLIKNSYLLTAYELEEQKLRLKELKEKIGLLAEDALAEKNKNTKLLRMLGVYGGALLCVIIF